MYPKKNCFTTSHKFLYTTYIRENKNTLYAQLVEIDAKLLQFKRYSEHFIVKGIGVSMGLIVYIKYLTNNVLHFADNGGSI